MRDIKRIDRILDMLKEEWKKSPDQRFYQFLINNGLMNDDFHFWHIEDDKIEEHIKKLSKDKKKGKK